MSFLNLSALGWFALAVPIIGFYILKIRLRRVPVATVLFWQQIFEQKQPKSIWQHLRHLLSLLIQLALLGLLILALSEPFFRGDAKGARRIVLIVDNSASMNAADVAPNRLSQAKFVAKQSVDNLRFLDEMAILAAGTEPRVVMGLTDHASTLRDAIDAIPATDGPTRVVETIALARRLLSGQPNPQILVITDGDFDHSTEDSVVQFVAIGGKVDNLGITRFQVRRSLVDPIGYEVLVEVRNASSRPARSRLELDLNGDTVDVVPLDLKADEVWTRTFEKTSIDGGRLAAVLNQPDKSERRVDGLAADNQAVALLPQRVPQHVTLSKGNLFLRKVFEAIPLVDLSLATAPPALSQLPAGGITVYFKEVPDVLPPGPVMVIDPQKPHPLWKIGEPLVAPVVAKQDRDSPVHDPRPARQRQLPRGSPDPTPRHGSGSGPDGGRRPAPVRGPSHRGACRGAHGRPRSQRPAVPDGVPHPHDQRPRRVHRLERGVARSGCRRGRRRCGAFLRRDGSHRPCARGSRRQDDPPPAARPNAGRGRASGPGGGSGRSRGESRGSTRAIVPRSRPKPKWRATLRTAARATCDPPRHGNRRDRRWPAATAGGRSGITSSRWPGCWRGWSGSSTNVDGSANDVP